MPDLVRELNKTIDGGDADGFERLLASIPDVNARDASGWRPLQRAIHAGAATMVERLLERGASANPIAVGGADRYDESSPLQAAINKARPDLVALLLRHGAAPRKPARSEPDPLASACTMANLEIGRLLLDAGAAVDGEEPMTPLMCAARAASPDVVRLLLERRADVNGTDRDGRTALWWAASASPHDCAPPNVVKINSREDLAKAFDLPPPPTDEQVERHEAKIVETVRLLLDRGPNVNVQDITGRPPLGAAKCVSVAKLLVERGARLDLRDRNKHGVHDWFKLAGISPAAVGIASPPAAAATTKPATPKRTAEASSKSATRAAMKPKRK